ncbi:alpha-hydroxy-acid oxidizing enzyme [Novosphingobium sp. PC22D]|nr:alpha-hydroxy-acid oxidizing enzyme [Novosphingobium sp. PC22D]
MLSRAQSIADLRARAHKLMPRFVLEYLEGGAGEEAALTRERTAFADWRFLPRMLRDVSHRSARHAVLDRDARLPLAIAPTGLNGLFMRHADLALARAAARFGVPFIQSTMSNETMEDVARIPGLRHWWQLYVFGGERIWHELVDRALACGCEALVLTVNSQVYGMREWDERQRIGRSLPSPSTTLDAARHPRWLASTLNHGMPEFANVRHFLPEDKRGFFEGAFWIRDQMPKDLGWRHVEAIRKRWHGPLLIKGLIHPGDVREAMEHGVDGVILGTHGGRQADWSVSALDVLPEVRELVPRDKALMISGGIRRGSDILKALALGADAVLTGRATLYGLCAHGEGGVRKALEILETEMLNDLGQIGVETLDQLGSNIVVPAKDPPALHPAG